MRNDKKRSQEFARSKLNPVAVTNHSSQQESIMANKGNTGSKGDASSSLGKWKSPDGIYRGGFIPVHLSGGDPYARDPSTTK